MIGLADRWKCPPGQVLAQDARVLRWLDVYERGHRGEEGGEV